MRPHEKLDVWRKSIDLTVDIYKVTDDFPKDERFGLISQVRRASISIAANIAEGAARRSDREFLNFLSFAQGSASEVETELLISYRLDYISEDNFGKLMGQIDEIGKMITGLSGHLKARVKS